MPSAREAMMTLISDLRCLLDPDLNPMPSPGLRAARLLRRLDEAEAELEVIAPEPCPVPLWPAPQPNQPASTPAPVAGSAPSGATSPSAGRHAGDAAEGA